VKVGREALLLVFAAGFVLFAPKPVWAQNFGLGASPGDSGKPINIEAEQGIEWQQNNHVYIARGHARATRGQTTIFADTLMAFYRPAGGQAAARAKNPPTHNESTSKEKSGSSSDPLGGDATEIYRFEADGNVRIVTETQTVYGDHAIYDVDKTVLLMTGRHLKLETPRDTVTARDSLEWYDNKQLAVARGDAVAVSAGKRLRGDVMMAEVVKSANEASHVSRIDAHGNVLVSSQDQIARGDAGVYDVDTGIATLRGRVTLTRANNELRGQYAVVDLNNNVSRLLSAPPDTHTTTERPRVHGLLVPRQQPGAPAK
jgi:lipopolysaccharide export system protein LptA